MLLTLNMKLFDWSIRFLNKEPKWRGLRSLALEQSEISIE